MPAFLFKIPVLNVFVNVLAHLLVVLSVLAWCVAINSFVWFGLMTKKRETMFSQSWSRFLMWLYNLKIEVTGLEHYQSDEGLVIISNHQSLFDIPVVHCIFNGPVKMIGKKELFNIPFFGSAMRGVKFVAIDRGNQKSGAKAQAELSDRLKKGYQIWMAVEGTRSKTGELLPFKKGAFRIAKENQVSLLPMVVIDAMKICPKGSLMVRGGGVIRAKVLPPFTPEEYKNLSHDQMSDEMFKRMSKVLHSVQVN